MIDPAHPDYANTPVSRQRPRFGYAPAEPPTASSDVPAGGPLASPHVSIVTPYFNTGPIFHETAASVLGQSFQQFEWIIVNDGSTDPAALAVLDGYRQRDPRIRVVDHPTNRGLSAARNTGYREARSDYVAQLDSDDLLEPTAVEKWLWCLESHPEHSFVKGFTVAFGDREYLWDKGYHWGRHFLQDNMVDANGMVRRSVHQAVGGFDEGNRGGLEDWDFWLRCASAGYWGATIPEYHDWYRRRPTHGDRWANFDGAEQQERFRRLLRERYPRLWEEGGFPDLTPRRQVPWETVPEALPFANRLAKQKPRLLMLLPWLTLGGADKFNLDLLGLLGERGWEVSVATTLRGEHPWAPQFTRHTPDVFILERFLRLVDYPRFLGYLIASRQIDVVLISNSELGYLLLPHLRWHHPEVAFVDFCHMEEEHWRNGNYPRLAVEQQELLDLNVVSSEHVRSWMAGRGGDPERIHVCYTNVDIAAWRPDAERRATTRGLLGVADHVPLLLYAGRVCAQKQPRVFAETALALRQEFPDAIFVVAGDGPDLPALRAFAAEHGMLANTRILGAVPNSCIRDLLCAVDLFFLPSLWEGISLAIFEAMAAGVPVVGADVGGQRELVTSAGAAAPAPECGVLVPRGDEASEAAAYARAIAELLRSPERRRQIGRAARERVSQHFRLEQMGERMDWLLREALRQRAARPGPPLTAGRARACAAQVVEYTRTLEVLDEVWAESQQLRALLAAGPPAPAPPAADAPPAAPAVAPHLIDPRAVRWRVLLGYTITQLPVRYYWGALAARLRTLLGRRRPAGGYE